MDPQSLVWELHSFVLEMAGGRSLAFDEASLGGGSAALDWDGDCGDVRGSCSWLTHSNPLAGPRRRAAPGRVEGIYRGPAKGTEGDGCERPCRAAFLASAQLTVVAFK